MACQDIADNLNKRIPIHNQHKTLLTHTQSRTRHEHGGDEFGILQHIYDTALKSFTRLRLQITERKRARDRGLTHS